MKIQSIARVGALLAGLVAFSTGVQAAKPEYTFKLHHFLPPMANPHSKFLAPWAEKVMKESNGRIQIDLYPAMQLGGKPPHLFDQARKGKADITWTVAGYTPGRFPKGGVFELPFMPVNAEATSMALWEYSQEEMKDELKDVHVLALHTHAPGSLHSREPISKMEDMEGLKLRTPNKLMAGAFSPMGVNPVFMPVPQMPSALQKGVLDVAVLPFEVVAPMKIQQLVHNHTEIKGERGMYTQFFIFSMNKKAYNKLPADLKKVIDDNSGLSLSREAGRVFDASEAQGYAAAQKEGNKFITLSPEETARWAKSMAPVTEKWIKDTDNGQALYDKASALISKYADEVGK